MSRNYSSDYCKVQNTRNNIHVRKINFEQFQNTNGMILYWIDLIINQMTVLDLLGQQRQPKAILSILFVHWMVALGEVVEEFHLLAVPRNDGNSITSFLNPTCKTFFHNIA